MIKKALVVACLLLGLCGVLNADAQSDTNYWRNLATGRSAQANQEWYNADTYRTSCNNLVPPPTASANWTQSQKDTYNTARNSAIAYKAEADEFMESGDSYHSVADQWFDYGEGRYENEIYDATTIDDFQHAIDFYGSSYGVANDDDACGCYKSASAKYSAAISMAQYCTMLRNQYH